MMEQNKPLEIHCKSKEEWLETRKGINNGITIGGSEAAAAMGLNPFWSGFQLGHEKLGNFIVKEENPKMYWGKRLEPIVLEDFVKETGLEIFIPQNTIYVHPEYPWMTGTPDALVLPPDLKSGVDAKTASFEMKEKWEIGIPPYLEIQGLHYMAVFDYEKWYFPALIGGNDFRVFYIERDEEMIKKIIELEYRFCENLKKGLVPAPDGSESATETLKKLYPRVKKEKISLSEQAMPAIINYERYKEKEKEMKKYKDEAANLIKAEMGEYEKGEINEYSVALPLVEGRESCDMQKLRLKYPQVYEECVKRGDSYRQIHIGRIKRFKK